VKLDPVGGTKVVHVGFSADGKILSAAARKNVIAWSLFEPSKPKELHTDNYAESAHKIGGDGRRLYYYDTSSSALRYYEIRNNGHDRTDFKGANRLPLAFGAIPDAESALAAVLCTDGNKKAVLVFVGLGDTWELAEGLKAPDANPNSVGFSPDGKWLVVCSGGAVMVWRVPGSQKVSGKPRSIDLGTGTYTAAAAGPGNLLAIAEKSGAEGGKVRVHLVDLAATDAKALTTFATDIEDVSALAFAPEVPSAKPEGFGKALAVADTVEGVVQLWALPAKK
jgi:WD40 repeat protein